MGLGLRSVLVCGLAMLVDSVRNGRLQRRSSRMSPMRYSFGSNESMLNKKGVSNYNDSGKMLKRNLTYLRLMCMLCNVKTKGIFLCRTLNVRCILLCNRSPFSGLLIIFSILISKLRVIA